jgi:hypothetical protein
MVGDVNMFLPDGVSGEAECEIMIAGTYFSAEGVIIAERQERKIDGKDSLVKP